MKSYSTILIADAGSTKTDWCLIDSNGTVKADIKTKGLNVALAYEDQLIDYLRNARNLIYEVAEAYSLPIKSYNPNIIRYYGAGCASKKICEHLREVMSKIWMCPDVEVMSDMLGACRALSGKQPGIACILGTGSNSALYDGVEIVANTPPLGYILGDEGSGTALGKRLISDIFKGIAPDSVISDFLAETKLTKDEVIAKVYREKDANRFLASFAPYILEHISIPYFHELVRDEFLKFLKRNVINYKGIADMPVSFIGSIAVNFKQQLRESLSSLNLNEGKIISSPMAGLIEYHTATI